MQHKVPARLPVAPNFTLPREFCVVSCINQKPGRANSLLLAALLACNHTELAWMLWGARCEFDTGANWMRAVWGGHASLSAHAFPQWTASRALQVRDGHERAVALRQWLFSYWHAADADALLRLQRVPPLARALRGVLHALVQQARGQEERRAAAMRMFSACADMGGTLHRPGCRCMRRSRRRPGGAPALFGIPSLCGPRTLSVGRSVLQVDLNADARWARCPLCGEGALALGAVEHAVVLLTTLVELVPRTAAQLVANYIFVQAPVCLEAGGGGGRLQNV